MMKNNLFLLALATLLLVSCNKDKGNHLEDDDNVVQVTASIDGTADGGTVSEGRATVDNNGEGTFDPGDTWGLYAYTTKGDYMNANTEYKYEETILYWKDLSETEAVTFSAHYPRITEEIADPVEIYLVSDGYKVYKASNALEGLEILEKETIHLVLLDIMMPGMDGLEMCRKIRETNNIPIIMLSARSADLDKILGLGTGADDYVTKPFNPLELTARVKSQLRRYTQLNPQSGAGNQVKNEISIKGLTINKDNHKVTVYGEEIKLTPIEFDILYLLASNPGRVFSTDEIFEKVWNEKVYEANNTVMVHIRRLRGKMKEDTRQNKIITTVWGVGYKIEK